MSTKLAELDSLFLRAAFKEKVISKEVAKECLRLQQQEAERGVRYSAGQVLIKHRKISAADFLAVQRRLDRKIFECGSCKTTYRARELENDQLHCQVCRQDVALSGGAGFTAAEILTTTNPDTLTLTLEPKRRVSQNPSQNSTQIPNQNPTQISRSNPEQQPAAPVWGAPKSSPTTLPPVLSAPKASAPRTSAPGSHVPELAARDDSDANAKTVIHSEPKPSAPPQPIPPPQAPQQAQNARYRPALDFSNESLAELDRFEVLEELGRGGMGVVFKARQKGMERLCALKVIATSAQVPSSQINRFVQEGRSAAQLHHPNIVKVYDCGREASFFYIAMEFVQGRALSDLIKAGALDLERRFEVILEVLEAVEYAHQKGVVHRDLKPQNILVEDGTGRALLIDFGLAKDFSQGMELTQPGQILGSPFYLSPEQTRGESYKVDGRSDVFALGVLLYELAAGTRPFLGRSAPEVYAKILQDDPTPPSKISKDVDGELEDIILKALQKDPAQRFQSAQNMAEALNAYCWHRFGGADTGPSSAERSRRDSQERSNTERSNTERTSHSERPSTQPGARRTVFKRPARRDSKEAITTAELESRLDSKSDQERTRTDQKRSPSALRPARRTGQSGRIRAALGGNDRARTRAIRAVNPGSSNSSGSPLVWVLLGGGLVAIALTFGLMLGRSHSNNTDPTPRVDPANNPNLPPPVTPDNPSDPTRPPLPNDPTRPPPDLNPDLNPDSNPSNTPPDAIPMGREALAQRRLTEIEDRFKSNKQADFGELARISRECAEEFDKTSTAKQLIAFSERMSKLADESVDALFKESESWIKARDFERLRHAFGALSERCQGLAARNRLLARLVLIDEQRRADGNAVLDQAEKLISQAQWKDAREILEAPAFGIAELDARQDALLAKLNAAEKTAREARKDANAELAESARKVFEGLPKLLSERNFSEVSARLDLIDPKKITEDLVETHRLFRLELTLLQELFTILGSLGEKLNGLKLNFGNIEGLIVEADKDKVVFRPSLGGGRINRPFRELEADALLKVFEVAEESRKPRGYLLVGLFLLREGRPDAAREAFQTAIKRGLEIEPAFLARARVSPDKPDPKAGSTDPGSTTGAGKDRPDAELINAKIKGEFDFIPIEGGAMLLGTNAGFVSSVPQRTVQVSFFQIMRFEVSNRLYRKFLQEMAKSPDPHKFCNKLEGPDKDHRPDHWDDPAFARFFGDALPVVFVDWYDACAFAAFYKCRLPTEAEWEKAARSTDGRTYPWNGPWDRSRCVSGNYWVDQDGDPRSLEDLLLKSFITTNRRLTEPVNGLPRGATFNGLHHMSGNVAEWCHDWFHEKTYEIDIAAARNTNPMGPKTGSERAVRGGSFIDCDERYLTAFKRFRFSPTTRQANLGFRVIKPSVPYRPE
jgi:serine/threonine protein kinase/formylglycine-generating enzyme required for sulfatase activity